MSEFLKELRDNWDNSYWWADHPTLRVALLSIISGAIGVLFVYLNVKVEQLARREAPDVA